MQTPLQVVIVATATAAILTAPSELYVNECVVRCMGLWVLLAYTALSPLRIKGSLFGFLGSYELPVRKASSSPRLSWSRLSPAASTLVILDLAFSLASWGIDVMLSEVAPSSKDGALTAFATFGLAYHCVNTFVNFGLNNMGSVTMTMYGMGVVLATLVFAVPHLCFSDPKLNELVARLTIAHCGTLATPIQWCAFCLTGCWPLVFYAGLDGAKFLWAYYDVHTTILASGLQDPLPTAMVVLLYVAEVVSFIVAVLTIMPRIKLSVDIVMASISQNSLGGGRTKVVEDGDGNVESEPTFHNRPLASTPESPTPPTISHKPNTFGRKFVPRRSPRLRSRAV